MAIIGYRYYFDIHMGVGRGPVDELIEIRVGDKTAWRGSVTANSQITIDAGKLFGGDKKEGGIAGTLDVLMGGPTQVAPASMTSVFGTLPGFRRMFTLFFSGQISANNPYPKKWAFRHRRILQGWDGAVWYPETAVINLIRTVSGAESNAPGGNTTLNFSETIDASARGTNYTVKMGGLTGTLTSVSLIQDYYSDYIEGGGYSSSVDLVAGVDYTVAGNVITFLTPPDLPGDLLYAMIKYEANVDLAGAGEGGLGDTLIKSMNPAHVIYEALTNREWGRGLSSAKLNDTAFRETADVLYAENLGFCRRWSRRDEIQTFVQSVLDQIGAVLYEDRQGLLTLRLIRDDYKQDQLPLFDIENGLLEIGEATVSSPTKMVNEIRVTYRDPVTNEDRVVRASNLAALQASGGSINVLSKEYPGVPTAEIASRLAKRDLKAAAPGLRRFSLTFDRRAFSLYPGGVVRIQDLQRNIPDMVLRIATIDYGTLRDGKIKVTAVQDVFGTPKRGFTVIGPPTWTPPNSTPCVGDYQLYELPYRTQYRRLSTADFNVLENTSAYLGIAIEQGNPLNLSTDVAVRGGAPEVEDNPPDDSYYCGYGA